MNDRRPPHDPESDMPPEDDLLEAVGEMARDDEAATPRRELLRRLVAGEATEEEIATLEREAETSEEARRDLEAFRPLGPELRERILESLPKKTAEVTPFPTSDASTPAPPQPMRGAWIPLAAAALLAVAAGLWWIVAGVPGPSADFELAAYSPELSGQVRDQRSGDVEPEELPAFEMGSTFRLVLRPEHETATDPDFDFYLADEDGVLRPWNVGYARSANDALKIEGILGEDLEIEPGTWTFVFVWGEPGELPEPTRLDDVADDAGPWRALSVPFRVVPGKVAFGELPLEVEYTGCFEVTSGPICAAYPEMTVWARSEPNAEITARLDGVKLGPEAVPVDGGRRFRLAVSEEAETLRLEAHKGVRSATFEITLQNRFETPVMTPWLHEAHALAYQGDEAGLRRHLDKHLDRSTQGRHRGIALSFLAWTTASEEERITLLEEAADLHRANGLPIRLSQDLGMLLIHYVRQRDFASLRHQLDATEAAGFAELPVRAEIKFAYYRGILESDVGNYRGALRALRSVADRARRVGLSEEVGLPADTKLAEVLHRLGRSEEAATRLRRAVDAPGFSELRPCLRVRIHNAHAWIAILADDQLGSPLPHLDRARELASTVDCGDRTELNLWLNRALGLAAEGSTWEAHRALVEAEALRDAASTLDLLWWADLEGRLSLAEGRAGDALDHFRRMERLAANAFEPEGIWRATVRKAEALDRLGRTEEALGSFARAEALLDEQSLRVPLGEGRAAFVADRDESAGRYLELLLRAGRSREALDVARRSRSRALASIRRGHRLAHLDPQAQVRWDLHVGRYLAIRSQLEAETADNWVLAESGRQEAEEVRAERRERARASLDEAFRALGDGEARTALRPLRPDETLLAYHPLPEGWVGFAATGDTVSVHHIELREGEEPSPQQWSQLLLEPFRSAIRSGDQLRVLPYGRLREVDFHALPWDDDILLAARPVVYGLELEPVSSTPSDTATGYAVVVADPRGDLPAARREANAVVQALARTGELVEGLVGSAATHAALLDALPRADVFHFAGHGVAERRLGSSLLVAGDGELSVGDVLSLGRSPAEVVLSSCEGARDAGARAPGLGLAQAFLVAGARGVVAAVRPVGDSDTEGLFRHFYSPANAAETGDGDGSTAARLRRSQLAWRDENPAADWASFRLMVP